MIVWITGCAGFLGTRLAIASKASGHTVIGLSRRESPAADRSVRIDLASDGADERLRSLQAEGSPPEIIVHAAARQPGHYTLAEYTRSNTLTTARLLDSLDHHAPRLLIFTSTLSVYGVPEMSPVAETHPPNGRSPYALTKRWGEQLVEGLRDRTGVVILRLPSLYGAGQANSFIDGMARQALENKPIELFSRGEIVRDALHVDDVIRAVLACLSQPLQSPFSCMNLGCGRRITVREYAQALVDTLGSHSSLAPSNRPSPQPFDLYADIREAQRLIRFQPTSLVASLARYADELRTQS